ncbi:MULTISPECIES: hypothetical protein [Mesorhizobium]|uniref:hypothetical protein n=1 Tax=Mesorhizobium TaxID=68287 RepID=UPI001FEF9758|nr:hypothetical protein [Mesorhizobium silamurunense]
MLLYGSEPVHEGEALAEAIIETVERLTRYATLRNPAATHCECVCACDFPDNAICDLSTITLWLLNEA